MLRLRHRHAVARHDDDLAGVLQHEGGVLGRALLHRPLLLAGGRTRDLAAEAAEDDRDEAAVHALAHDVGEDRAGGADQRAGDDQRRIAEREADAGRRPAGIGIEHRDHDRHVGAADRDDDEHAEGEGGERQQPERDVALAARTNQTISSDDGDRERDVDDVARRQDDRRAAHAAGELQERDHRAGEGDGADGDAERHLDQARAVDMRRRCRCRRRPAHRARPPPPAPPPCRPANGRRRPAPASRSSARAARSPRRCRRRSRCRGRPAPRRRGSAGGCEASVVTMAIAMPTMPNRLPCRLVSGLDRPRSARMNRTPATR